jgi:hypothetical protein
MDEVDNTAAAISLAQAAGDYTNSDKELEVYLHHVWYTIYWMMKQIPYNDTRQDRMVDLIKSFSDNHPFQDDPPRSDYQDLWRDLPGALSIWWQYALAAPITPKLSERAAACPEPCPIPPQLYPIILSPVKWANLNAFLARLVSKMGSNTTMEGRSLTYFRLTAHALYALLDALEDANDEDELAKRLPAAACWILYGGLYLKSLYVEYHEEIQPAERECKRWPWSAGDIYTGSMGFNSERWNFWKDRFHWLRVNPGLRHETRQWAAESWRKMSSLDSDNTRVDGGHVGDHFHHSTDHSPP